MFVLCLPWHVNVSACVVLGFALRASHPGADFVHPPAETERRMDRPMQGLLCVTADVTSLCVRCRLESSPLVHQHCHRAEHSKCDHSLCGFDLTARCAVVLLLLGALDELACEQQRKGENIVRLGC